jgi:protein-S-isoprenylcysteine O-methyltransferase Ste14
MMQLVALAAGSLVLLYVSRASLRAPGAHGFYRFFAWEAMLGLFLLNADRWFVDPLSWNQLCSWFLLFASLAPLAFGVRTLVAKGKPADRRGADASLLAFEKTTVLVTTGIYRYIRHPLYSSLLLLTWGIFFKAPDWPGLALAVTVSLLLLATARADEAECIRFFGPAYQAYMKTTRRFVPFLF